VAKAGKILLIDDSELVRTRVQTRLGREGYEVITTSEAGRIGHGREALHAVKQAAAAAGATPACFLYTSDKTVSLKHRELGFDGSVINKGDDESLVQQLQVALRLTRLEILRLSCGPR
jgi:hypothetical protein